MEQIQDRTAALVQFATRHAAVSVPVLPNAVRDQLRALGLPVRLFGENLAQVRERLRQALAQRHVLESSKTEDATKDDNTRHHDMEEEEPEEVTQYTRASARLIQVREAICQSSIQQAMDRLARERIYKALARKRKYGTSTKDETTADEKDDATTNLLDALDQATQQTVQHAFTLQGSQYADARAVAGLVVVDGGQRVVTGSWNAQIKVWDSASLSCVATQEKCHEDRIMGLAASPGKNPQLLCSTSLDRTAKVWKMETTTSTNDSVSIKPVATLSGHAQRLAQAAFHPHVPNIVATTSYDHTWRLWDINTTESSSAQQLLLQDGHAAAVHGLTWHPDGSLCITTDTLGVVHAWDIRTGQSIRHWMIAGARRQGVVVQCYSSALQLVTGDSEGVLRVYDWRRPKRAALTIPAHGNAVTRMTHTSDSGVMATSSFDGTVKVWNPAANYQCVTTLAGHDGKVSGVAFVSPTKLVSCGHDKTLKVWC